MSSTLPLEIVEYVVDKAQDDVSSLRNLSLVCHDLLPRCRYQLFQTVGFKNRIELRDLCDFLASKPHFRSLVRSIVVRAVPGVPHCLTLLEVVPVPLLSLLPNLRGWTLSTKGIESETRDWSSFSNQTLACLRHYSSRIRTLQISSVHFRTCSELARLVVAFEGLEDLSCTNIRFQCEGEISEPLRQMLSSQLHLKHLSVHDVQGCATSLLTHSSYSSLRELDLDIAPHSEGTPVTYLHDFSCLECIALTITHAGTRGDELPNSFSVVRSMLASFDSSTLKHLTLRIDYSCTPPPGDQNIRSECHKLEKLLLERVFNHLPLPPQKINHFLGKGKPKLGLQSVVISVVNARRHGFSLEHTVLSYERCFRTLSEMGLLRVVPDVTIPIAGHNKPVIALAVSADSTLVASSSRTSIIIWDAQTSRAIRQWRTFQTTKILAFSPNSARPCLASGDPITLCNFTQDPLLAVLLPHSQSIGACVWSPDGARIVSSSTHHEVLVWDAETYAQLHMLNHYPAHICCVLFSPDGQRIVTGSVEGVVRVWDVATGAKLADMPHLDEIKTMAYHPDGVCIAIAFCGAGEVRLFNVDLEGRSQWQEEAVLLLPDREGGSIPVGDGGEMIAFSRDGKQLLYARRIAHSGHLQEYFRDEACPWSVRHGVQWRVWDTLSGKTISKSQLTEYSMPLYAVAFSLDRNYVAIGGSEDGEVKMWMFGRNEECLVKTFTEHSTRVWECVVTHVTFSPDGTILASGALDGSVFIRRPPSPSGKTPSPIRPYLSIT